MESPKRDPFIDMLKGIGILLVIWGYSSLFLFNEIYSFHMPLFFFLSGCFFKTNVSTFCFIKKKFIQLLFLFKLSILYSDIGNQSPIEYRKSKYDKRDTPNRQPKYKYTIVVSLCSILDVNYLLHYKKTFQ